jgi:hypothetical protein
MRLRRHLNGVTSSTEIEFYGVIFQRLGKGIFDPLIRVQFSMALPKM